MAHYRRAVSPFVESALFIVGPLRRVGGEPMSGVDDLVPLLNGERIGRTVELVVSRKGKCALWRSRPSSAKPRSLKHTTYQEKNSS
jgi:hypothetical protein